MLKTNFIFIFTSFIVLIGCNRTSVDEKNDSKIEYKDVIADIKNDMLLPHEAVPHGIPEGYDWKYKPRLGAGNNCPSDWKAFIPWGQLFVDETQANTDNPAPNTRVALKDLKVLLLNKKGEWSEIESLPLTGAWYEENFSDNINIPTEIRKEKNESISIKSGSGYNFHFYWDKRIGINADDILGMVVMVSAQLVLDDITKPDDRSKSKYILSVGADYWRDFSSVWLHNEQNNMGVGLGRFKKVGMKWQKYYMHTLADDTWYKYPIPEEMLLKQEK